MGGENPFLFYGGSSDSGSPPHGRGKVPYGPFPLQPARITPAWAGKSRCSSAKGKAVQDHPRVGGEKGPAAQAILIIVGSPPHGRGKVLVVGIVLHRAGITPAWAGKRICDILGQLFGGDHPRVGGEKSSLLWALSRIQGSPPHGRGKGKFNIAFIVSDGITPA